MLSKQELKQFGRYSEDGMSMGVFPVPTAALTDAFIERVFECSTVLYDGETDPPTRCRHTAILLTTPSHGTPLSKAGGGTIRRQ